MRRILSIIVVLAAISLQGCGNGTSGVKGRVTYKGRAVTSGTVIFLQADGTARSCVIQPDGSYSIDGVARGHVRIGVLSPDPAHARSILRADENRAKNVKANKGGRGPATPAANGWFPLPKTCGDPERSGLACDVATSRVAFDIEIK